MLGQKLASIVLVEFKEESFPKERGEDGRHWATGKRTPHGKLLKKPTMNLGCYPFCPTVEVDWGFSKWIYTPASVDTRDPGYT